MSADEDLVSKSRDDLLAEVVRLRTAIRAHRDSSGLWQTAKVDFGN